MTKRGITVIYLMLGLVALWFISPAVANAQVTITHVKVTVSSAALTAVYCDTTLLCGASGGIQVWDLKGGVTLAPTETLVLTQTGRVAPGGNFDTSDQVTPTTLASCSPTNICTVRIEINGTQVYNSAAAIPLNFSNIDDGGTVTDEAHNWVLAVTQPNYTIKTGYADNVHSAGCPGGVPANCFPSPFSTGVTHFIGAGLTGEGSCSTNCYDAGALLITGVLFTPFTGCTVTQGGWGSAPHGNNPGAFLAAHFPAAPGVTIGLGYPNPTGPPFWLNFDAAVDIKNFLPQGGPPGPLTASALDPTLGTSAGVFAGQVLALALNVQLEHFGSLVLSGTGTSLDGKTVAQVLAAANLAISGGALPAGFSYSSLNDLVDNLNESFDGCAADTWATIHLH